MLSDTWLRKNNGRPVDKDFFKADSNGLTARVRKNGTITFILRSYLSSGQRINLTLGRYPEIGLKEARSQASEYRLMAQEGHDPRLKKKVKIVQNSNTPTIDYLYEFWYENCAKQNKKNAHDHKRSYEIHLQPDFGAFLHSDIEKRVWIAKLREISQHTPEIAMRLLRDIHQTYQYAYESGIIEIDNPLTGIGRRLLGIKKKKRERILDDSEIRLFYKTLYHPDYHTSQRNKVLMELALFYGCRIGELRLAKIKDLDFENMLWTVPPENHKTGQNSKSIIRPILPEMAHLWQIAIQESQDPPTPSEYVFRKKYKWGEDNTPMSLATIQTIKSRIHAFAISHFKNEDNEPITWEHWAIHDLRRTARSYWSPLGDFSTVEKMLGHSIKGVHGIYDRYNYLPQMTEVYKQWWAILKSLESGDQKVVQFKPNKAS